MTAPISRDRQIELMMNAAERMDALALRLLANPTIRSVAVTRSLKEAEKTSTVYKTAKAKKVG
ncbi:MAG: hypothetical protein LCH39_13820 [Proteobacteria bacterium]|nr:hypothetical protein [Pseudomonadota bacterium]